MGKPGNPLHPPGLPDLGNIGGDGGKAAAAQIAATPVPAASPPITPATAEVAQAGRDARRQALKKRGFSKTIFAGDVGGWFPGNLTPSPTNPKQTGLGAGGSVGAGTLGS